MRTVCFQVFDRDGSGAISRDEFIQVFVHALHHHRPSEMEISDEMDHDSIIVNPVQEEDAMAMMAQADEEDDDEETKVERVGPSAKTFQHSFDPRRMEIDPVTYQETEMCADLFDSLDHNNDNQVRMFVCLFLPGPASLALFQTAS